MKRGLLWTCCCLVSLQPHWLRLVRNSGSGTQSTLPRTSNFRSHAHVTGISIPCCSKSEFLHGSAQPYVCVSRSSLHSIKSGHLFLARYKEDCEYFIRSQVLQMRLLPYVFLELQSYSFFLIRLPQISRLRCHWRCRVVSRGRCFLLQDFHNSPEWQLFLHRRRR